MFSALELEKLFLFQLGYLGNKYKNGEIILNNLSGEDKQKFLLNLAFLNVEK